MRFVEIRGGLRVQVSNDEQIVADIIRDHREPMPKSKLNLRERELARSLVQKNIVDRIKIDEKTHFVYNDLDELWR